MAVEKYHFHDWAPASGRVQNKEIEGCIEIRGARIGKKKKDGDQYYKDFCGRDSDVGLGTATLKKGRKKKSRNLPCTKGEEGPRLARDFGCKWGSSI